MDAPGSEAEEEAVLLGYAVEAPGEVRRVTGEIEAAAHPFAAPGSRIEEWNEAKRACTGAFEGAAVEISGDQSRGVGEVRVEVVVDPAEHFLPPPVGRAPVHEVGALVQRACGRSGVGGSEVADGVTALALLDLPAGDVGVDEHVRVRHDEARARSDHEHDSLGDVVDPPGEPLPALGGEEVVERPWAHEAEDRIAVAEVGVEETFQLVGLAQGLLCVDLEHRQEPGSEGFAYFRELDARIALHRNDAPFLGSGARAECGAHLGPAFGAVGRVAGDREQRVFVVAAGQS